MGTRNRTRTAPRRTDTSDPAWSRERALRILFQADLRGVEPSVTLARLDADEQARSLLDEHDCLGDEEPILPAEGAGGRRPPASPPAGAPATASHVARSEADPGPSSSSPRPSASGWADVARAGAAPIDGFTRTLVLGVERDRDEVEALISRYARRWAIPRMPVVDRNVLRLATYELLHEPTPAAVVLNEAIGLAKRLSTEDSGRFVNGVLESIRQELARTRADTAPGPGDPG